VWSSINSTDTKQQVRIHRQFASLCQNRSFTYVYALTRISLNLYKVPQSAQQNTLLGCNVCNYAYSVLKCGPSLLSVTDIPVLPLNFETSSLFTVAYKNSSSAECVSAANHLRKNVYTFTKPTASLEQVLC